MTTPVIRLATSADSDAILGIYAPYIDTSITFEEEVPAREAFQARTDGVLSSHPYLVAEFDGKVVGYAYAHELRERGAGFKSGQWHDVTWYVKFLTDRFEDDPASPVPFPLLCDQQPQAVKDILDRANSSLR